MFLLKMSHSSLLLLLLIEIGHLQTILSQCAGRSLINSGVSAQDKQMIIDIHNKLRQFVALGQVGNQPPASNMIKLRWSDELAQKAQYWATVCSPYVHDPQRHLGQYLVGQNVASKWTTKVPQTYYDTKPEWNEDAISKWFNEYTKYRFSSRESHEVAHYTQMVWAETDSVGCGFAYYVDQRKRYTKKYVCNYGPSGNVLGAFPYQKGYPSCSKYGFVESKEYPGLCEVRNFFKNYFTYNSNSNYNPNYYNYKHENSANNGFVFDVYTFQGYNFRG